MNKNIKFEQPEVPYGLPGCPDPPTGSEVNPEDLHNALVECGVGSFNPETGEYKPPVVTASNVDHSNDTPFGELVIGSHNASGVLTDYTTPITGFEDHPDNPNQQVFFNELGEETCVPKCTEKEWRNVPSTAFSDPEDAISVVDDFNFWLSNQPTPLPDNVCYWTGGTAENPDWAWDPTGVNIESPSGPSSCHVDLDFDAATMGDDAGMLTAVLGSNPAPGQITTITGPLGNIYQFTTDGKGNTVRTACQPAPAVEIPDSAFADAASPTSSEVEAWFNTNVVEPYCIPGTFSTSSGDVFSVVNGSVVAQDQSTAVVVQNPSSMTSTAGACGETTIVHSDGNGDVPNGGTPVSFSVWGRPLPVADFCFEFPDKSTLRINDESTGGHVGHTIVSGTATVTFTDGSPPINQAIAVGGSTDISLSASQLIDMSTGMKISVTVTDCFGQTHTRSKFFCKPSSFMGIRRKAPVCIVVRRGDGNSPIIFDNPNLPDANGVNIPPAPMIELTNTSSCPQKVEIDFRVDTDRVLQNLDSTSISVDSGHEGTVYFRFGKVSRGTTTWITTFMDPITARHTITAAKLIISHSNCRWHRAGSVNSTKRAPMRLLGCA